MRKLILDLILDLKKCPPKKCTFTFMRFPIGALPEVQNQIKKQFSHKVSYNFLTKLFSKHRPSGPMLSISWNVRPFVCLSVRLFVRVFTFEVPLNVSFPPLLKVRCPIFLEIWNPWGKVMERSSLRFEHFVGSDLKSPKKKKNNLAHFALQNKVETTLPDWLETSGRRVYR